MSIVDLLINELQVDDLSDIQLMTLACRLLDIAIEKLNNKEIIDNEEE